jgi:hypothetical protein
MPSIVQDKMASMRSAVVTIALGVAFGSVRGPSLAGRLAEDQNLSGAVSASRRMADGKQWMTENLNVNAGGSYCYADAEPNCRRYGRLYTWESAQQACQSLGGGWRLPTTDEWRNLAKH